MGKFQVSRAKYLGGIEQQKKVSGPLVFDDSGIHMRTFREVFRIPWDEVIGVTIEGPEDLNQRITASRLVTLGVFSLAAKKKTGECFLSVRTANYEAMFELEKTAAAQLRAKLAPWTTRLPAEPAPPPDGPGPSVAEQLTMLADLKNQGLLSDEEFAAQKAKLMS